MITDYNMLMDSAWVGRLCYCQDDGINYLQEYLKIKPLSPFLNKYENFIPPIENNFIEVENKVTFKEGEYWITTNCIYENKRNGYRLYNYCKFSNSIEDDGLYCRPVNENKLYLMNEHSEDYSIMENYPKSPFIKNGFKWLYYRAKFFNSKKLNK